MCLLCVRMPNAEVNPQYLRNANENNPDGSGFAILRSDLSAIDVFCSMDGDLAIIKYLEAIERDPECWSMFHARYATHGTSTCENVHPFRVGGSRKTVLAHNGILPVSVPKGSKRSDTRIFAESILPNMGLGVLDTKYDFEALSDWCAGSKIAIFSIDERLSNNIYIVNEELGDWENGTWWSNSGYKHSFASLYRSRSCGYDPVHGREYATSEPVDETVSPYDNHGACEICMNYLGESDYRDGVCGFCNSCLECFESIVSNCMCYTGSSAHAQLTY